MDGGTYPTWLEVIDDLSEPQRAEVQSILAGGLRQQPKPSPLLKGVFLATGDVHIAKERGPCAEAGPTACVGSSIEDAARLSTP